MRARDLDELHTQKTAEEILAAVKAHFALPPETTDMEVFVFANKKYYDGGSAEKACIDYQQFRQTRRVPLYVGSWLLHEPESA